LTSRWPPIAALVGILASVVGCSIAIEGTPVDPPLQRGDEICIIENPPVRAEFLMALTRVLQQRGFRVRVLDPNALTSACPLSASYLGKWSWDFVPYMATGDIALFREGSQVGEATYRAPRGGWALTFGIYRSTETKVGRMVDQLFPGQP
jgi:hypothetical protein